MEFEYTVSKTPPREALLKISSPVYLCHASTNHPYHEVADNRINPGHGRSSSTAINQLKQLRKTAKALLRLNTEKTQTTDATKGDNNKHYSTTIKQYQKDNNNYYLLTGSVHFFITPSKY